MKDEYIKRQADNPGAILNTDAAGLAAYRLQKQIRRDQEQRINNIEAKVDSINKDISMILSILTGKAND